MKKNKNWLLLLAAVLLSGLVFGAIAWRNSAAKAAVKKPVAVCGRTP